MLARPTVLRAAPFALALGLTLGVLAACGGSRTLEIAMDGAPLTLDPHHHNDNLTWAVLTNVYDGLVRMSPEMRVVPGLAESWEQVDPTRVRFRLRPGARFSNGQPVVADDVVASFERVRDDPRSGARHHLLGIVRVVAEDDRSILIESDGPSPTLLNRLAFLMIVPRADAASAEITTPLGSGPYRVRHADERSLLAEIWEGSWRQVRGVRRVRFLFFESSTVASGRFLAGGVTLVRELRDTAVDTARRHDGMLVVQQPGLYVSMLALNPDAATGDAARALADPQVRRAMLLACDRQRWVRELYRGAGEPAAQFVHPVVFGFDPAIPVPPHDPVAARALLAERGFSRGFQLSFEHAPAQRQLLARVVDDLGRVGIGVEMHERPWGELIARARGGKVAAMFFAWSCSSGDASDFLNACAHSPSPDRGFGYDNYSRWSDEETDRLIEAAERELDPLVRRQLLEQAQRRLLDSGRLLPLLLRSSFLGVAHNLEINVRHDQWLDVATYAWR